MFELSNTQIKLVSRKFKEESVQAHQAVWKKRQYAPMNIFKPEMKPLLDEIHLKLPNYTVLFDVVFESDGKKTDWHCDYESLGPFIIKNSWESISETHFASIHFNITENGGSLVTLDWTLMSYIYHFIIVLFGIFSPLHIFANKLLCPFFYMFGKVHSNTRGKGNFFDNMRLHSVNSGAPRISYVIRLAKNESVTVTADSIKNGIKRSDACLAFASILNYVEKKSLYASEIPWHTMET